MKYYYRLINLNETQLIKQIDPSQFIHRAWRRENGDYKLVTIDYMEESWPDGFDNYHNALIDTITNGGIAYGAFTDKDNLIGYAAVNRETFGETYKYVLLDSIFVSKDFRGHGIGKQLLSHCIDKIKKWDIDKLYTCAGSSEDTIAFYRKMGWVDALEINQKLYLEDTLDIQLEYDIYN